MNTLHQELIDKAHEIALQVASESAYRPLPGSIVFDQIEKNALIELVAKRCSAIAMSGHLSTSFDDHDDLDEYDRGFEDACSSISGKILTTFDFAHTKLTG